MSKFDYRDPGEDPAYCNSYGGHLGIERHCRDCGEVVFVSRDDDYQLVVICQRCEDQIEERLARADLELT